MPFEGVEVSDNQYSLFCTCLSSLQPGFLKIWRPFFISDLSVAVLKDTFWWFFLHKFKVNLTVHDHTFWWFFLRKFKVTVTSWMQSCSVRCVFSCFLSCFLSIMMFWLARVSLKAVLHSHYWVLILSGYFCQVPQTKHISSFFSVSLMKRKRTNCLTALQGHLYHCWWQRWIWRTSYSRYISVCEPYFLHVTRNCGVLSWTWLVYNVSFVSGQFSTPT